MIYGYCRCSTDETKQNIDRQVNELKAMGANHIYQEYGSGIKVNRREFQKLLAAVKPGDTIVATEVSRLTRSTTQLCDLIAFVEENRLKLEIKDGITLDCTNGAPDPMAKAMVELSGVFAELERSIISERVKSGIAAARSKGKQIGRKRVTARSIPETVARNIKTYIPDVKAGKMSKSGLARLCSISRPCLNKYLTLMSDAGIIDYEEGC